MKKIIRIAGTGYNGSTMLDMMLSNSPKGFSCGEINALFRPFRVHHFDEKCGCGDNTCNIWKRVKNEGECAWWKVLASTFPEVEYFVDSSKQLAWIKSQVKIEDNSEFEFDNLLIWKTPYEYAHSCIKRNKLKEWKKSYIDYHLRYLSFVTDFRSVSYSGLVKDTENKLTRISNVLGFDYKDGSKEYWGKKHHTLFGSHTAKLHLHDKSSSEFKNVVEEGKRYKPKINPEGDLEVSQHKTIYYDDTYKDNLPQAVINDIENDDVLKLIVKILELSEVDKDIDDIKFELRDAIDQLLKHNKPSELWFYANKSKLMLQYCYSLALYAFKSLKS